MLDVYQHAERERKKKREEKTHRVPSIRRLNVIVIALHSLSHCDRHPIRSDFSV